MNSQINCSIFLLRTDPSSCALLLCLWFCDSGPVPAHPSPWGSPRLVRFNVNGSSGNFLIASGSELYRPIDLEDFITADNSPLLQMVSILLHPPRHGTFFQTGTREINQGFLSYWLWSCWVNPVSSLVLTLCSYCIHEIFKKMPLSLGPGAFRAWARLLCPVKDLVDELNT